MKSIDQVLHDDARLSAKLQDMLPADVSPQQACAGFKTLEQCVTAIHLAQNLKVPFADLKAKTTGKGSVGLPKAIEQMAAGANAKDELKRAKKQAGDDMKGTSLFGQLFLQDQMGVDGGEKLVHFGGELWTGRMVTLSSGQLRNATLGCVRSSFF